MGAMPEAAPTGWGTTYARPFHAILASVTSLDGDHRFYQYMTLHVPWARSQRHSDTQIQGAISYSAHFFERWHHGFIHGVFLALTAWPETA